MISSKKITAISIALTAFVLVLTVLALFLPQEAITGNTVGTVSYSTNHSLTYTDDDYYSTYSESAVSKITLKGDYAEAASKNVSTDDGDVTILGSGTYVISGELTDGSIIVNAESGGLVRLILNGASVTSSDFAALYVKQAEKVVISTIKNTENYFSDATSYNEEKSEDGNPSAAVYSKDDLTINGEGALFITGNFADGIKVNDTLKIIGGALNVTAVDDGINANDAAAAINTAITVTSGGDAIKCEHEGADKGFIALSSSDLTVTTDGDGIYSSSALYFENTNAGITAGGGAGDISIQSGDFGGFGRGGFGFENRTSENTVSTKAIKAANAVNIKGGTFTLDSADDAIHSDGDINILGGTFTISTGDDAIHAELNADIAPDSLTVTKCREGIEGGKIILNGGDINIISSDDGINAVGENSGGGFGRPMGMHKENITDEDIYFTINSGNIRIETGGDGLDANGAVAVNGGNIEVYGPENSGNSSLDFEYGFLINKGSLLAAGSSGMAETPHEKSQQASLIFYLDESFDAESSISVTDSSGNEIISGKSSKRFDWVCVSTSALSEGETYTLSVDGAKCAEVTASGILTTYGNKGRGNW